MINYKAEISKRNLIAYKGKQPSIELVTQCLEKSGLTRQSFEIAYGIVIKTIQRYQRGLRGMPVKYWHIFYEFDTLDKFYSTFVVKQKRKQKKVEKEQKKNEPEISSTNKAIIDAIRERFSQR